MSKEPKSYVNAIRDYFLIGCNDNGLKAQLDFIFETIYNPIEIQANTAFEVDLMKKIYSTMQAQPAATSYRLKPGRHLFVELMNKYQMSSNGSKFYIDAYSKASKDYNNDKRLSPYEKKRLSILQNWINKKINDSSPVEISNKDKIS
jgi:hypothetical protein